MFENHAYDEVVTNPNFSKFAAMGVQFTDYYAITHPSQPNYWCQIAGSHFGVNSDSNYNWDYSNLIDLLEAKFVPWKAYMQDYPGNCYSGATQGKYYRKHNPFISFDDVRNNATRCSRIVNANQLDSDLASGNLPQYMYFTPNIDNDAHNTNISFAGTWLNGFLSPRLNLFPKGTLFVITWDEDDYTEENKIDTAMFGSMLTVPGQKDNNYYNHYSLLATVEHNWNLGNLGRNDATAKPFLFSKK